MLLLIADSPITSKCPWDHGKVELLMPSEGLPTNSHFWIRSYQSDSPASVGLRKAGSSEAIEIDVIERPFALDVGGLIEVVPRFELEPDTDYQVTYFQRRAIVRTGSWRDETPPSAPDLPRVSGNISPLQPCWESAVLVHLSPKEDHTLQLYEWEGDVVGVAAVATVSETGGVALIRAEEGRAVTFDVVAVDLAGNRSEAVGPVMAEADKPDHHDRPTGSMRRGCVCAAAPRGRVLFLLLAVGLAALSGRRLTGSSRRRALRR